MKVKESQLHRIVAALDRQHPNSVQSLGDCFLQDRQNEDGTVLK